MTQTVILTAAPGAVFVRLSGPVEMTPGEALRLSEAIRECARVALAAADGNAVLGMIRGT